MALKSLKYLNQFEIHKHTGLSRREIRHACENLKSTYVDGKATYHVPDVLSNHFTKKNDELKLAQAKLRTLSLHADAIELRNKATRETQVPIEDVARTVKDQYDMVKSELRAIPSRELSEAILKCKGNPALIQDLIQDAINEKLKNLSEDRTILGE